MTNCLKLYICLMVFCFLFLNQISAQEGFNSDRGCIWDHTEQECLPNTLLSALPFLRIVPDSRSGAMGDLGIAISPDANSMYFNVSKLAFAEKNLGLSLSYTPWLRDLGLDDVYLTYLSAYNKIDDLQTIGTSLRFFSLGQINFTDIDGNSLGMGQPREFEFSLAYARKLSTSLSAGLSAKFLYSNLASGQVVNGIDVSSASALAADFSLTYMKPISAGAGDSDFTFGVSFSNIGSKVTYTQSAIKDFLPMNLGLGTAFKIGLDEYNEITFGLDINKMLVPTPVFPVLLDNDGNISENPDYNSSGDPLIPDFREKSMFSALLGSFGDAPGGFSEELSELSFSLGVEYLYDKQFAVRSGYYYESSLKGDRKYLTVGVGILYNVFGLNLSYLVPTNNNRSPLDNTIRFTLNFNFEQSN